METMSLLVRHPKRQQTRAGNKYIPTFMDFASRYPDATALRKIDVETVAIALLEIFSRLGVPTELLTDQGSNFLSTLMKSLYDKLGIHHIQTSPYHPQTNGMLECFHATLKKTWLRRFALTCTMIGTHCFRPFSSLIRKYPIKQQGSPLLILSLVTKSGDPSKFSRKPGPITEPQTRL